MILLENDPYISALAEVYDTSSTPVLLTDGNLTPVYCNAACSQTYGGLCEPGVLKALVLPDGGCAEELLKDRHALRAEVRDMPFRALVLTRLYNDKGQTAAWRVMTEGDDKNGAALLRNENVRNTIRYELLKPCADILSTCAVCSKQDRTPPNCNVSDGRRFVSCALSDALNRWSVPRCAPASEN